MPARPDTASRTIPYFRALSPLQKGILRLLVIPLLLCGVWLCEVFLLDGSRALMADPLPLPLLLYTLISCIATGILIPVLVIRRSFASGAVIMDQVGFRPLRRTIAASLVTVAVLLATALVLLPPGTDRIVAALHFLLLLPTGIASVMVCWVLVGTHLQALVRAGGPLVSISAGVIITAVLFALVTRAATPPADPAGTTLPALMTGILIALFYFAVRDVYAVSFALTAGMALLYSGRTGPAVLAGSRPIILFCAAATLLALVMVHLCFSRRYTTVRVVPDH